MRYFYIFIILAILCTSCTGKSTYKASNEIGIVGGDECITRAQVAKQLALIKYTRDEINGLERTIKFNDTSWDKWYDKYINAAFSASLISGTSSDSFCPEEPLTIKQAQSIIDRLYSSGRLQLKYDEKDKDKPIPYSVWIEAYEKICEKNKFPIKTCSITIYATKSECNELGDDFILSNGGLISCEGTDISRYRDNTVYVLLRDRELAAVKSVVTNSPVLRAVVEEVENDKAGVKINGGVRYFKLDNCSIGEEKEITLGE